MLPPVKMRTCQAHSSAPGKRINALFEEIREVVINRLDEYRVPHVVAEG
jgi:hypothetical protein